MHPVFSTIAGATLFLMTSTASAQVCSEWPEVPARFDVLVAGPVDQSALINLRITLGSPNVVEGVWLLSNDGQRPAERLTPDTLLALVCADNDGDGVAGVIAIEVVLRNERTGDSVVAAIVPEAEVDHTGHVETTIRLTDGSGETRGWGGRPIWVTDMKDPKTRVSRKRMLAPDEGSSRARETAEGHR